MRPFNERGQFVPLTAMVLFTAVLFMVVGFNIYQVSKAKLQVQNLADATALAVASLEAKDVNTAIDRDEWLNHLYSNPNSSNKNQLPGISVAGQGGPKVPTLSSTYYKDYAQLVQTINQAQTMFQTAYSRFMGADPGTGSNGSGAASLADILSEIQGLNDPRIISVSVFNNSSGQESAQSAQSAANVNSGSTNLGSKLNASGMTVLNFKTEEVTVPITGGKSQTLTQLAGASTTVGWMHPVWNDPHNTLNVQVTKGGGTETHWGAGATIVRLVPLFLFGQTTVKATSLAYVVDGAGVAVNPNSTSTGSSNPKPPTQFRPTFYARLAYHP